MAVLTMLQWEQLQGLCKMYSILEATPSGPDVLTWYAWPIRPIKNGVRYHQLRLVRQAMYSGLTVCADVDGCHTGVFYRDHDSLSYHEL